MLKYAILNANYIRTRLEKDYDIVFGGKRTPPTGSSSTCAPRALTLLIDGKSADGLRPSTPLPYSFPVAGTVMVEPTESETGRTRPLLRRHAGHPKEARRDRPR